LSITKVRFANTQQRTFHETLSNRIGDYFKEQNLSIHANAEMKWKTAILLTAYFGCYLLILSGWFPLSASWLLCVGMGIAMAGIGFSIAHDAIHGAYSANKNVNYILGLSMNLIGGNRYAWNITHNIVHHTYTNIYKHDEDLQLAPFIRLTKHAPYHPIHRIQHFTAFIAYSLATFFWVFIKDYKKLSQPNIGPHDNRYKPKGEMTILIISKILYYIYTIIIPFWILNIAWWQFAIGFFTVHLTAGVILGVIFSLAHVVEETEHPIADEHGKMEDSWAVHQFKTTSNFAMNNSWVGWYVGGLNFQVEHHMFPNICSIHYPKISPIVQATANEFNVPYYYHETLVGAIASHYRQLKMLGRE
jgi:linoleoyl-CoA desaturase